MGFFGDLVGQITGSTARKQARAEAAKADSSREQQMKYANEAYDLSQNQMTDLGGQIATMQDRQNSIYLPMEAELAAQAGAIDTQGIADDARGEFTTQYDAAADIARRQAMAYGVQPGAVQSVRTERENAYDRARGAADVANTARTEADDAAFMRKNAFYQGNNLRSQLINGIQGMYSGAYQGAQAMAGQYGATAATQQANSNAIAQNAGGWLPAIASVAGTALGGPIGGAIAGRISGAISGGAPTTPATAATPGIPVVAGNNNPNAQGAIGATAPVLNSSGGDMNQPVTGAIR